MYFNTLIIHRTVTPDYRKFVFGSGITGGHTKLSMPPRQQGRHLTSTWFGRNGGMKSSKQSETFRASRTLHPRKYSRCGPRPPVECTAGLLRMRQPRLRGRQPLPRKTKTRHTFNRGKPFHPCVDLNDRRPRRATKLAEATAKKWAADQYNDLGMFCLTFYTYINKKEKMIVAV